ncbi:MAG: hypothetical protein WAK53_07970 [Chromatiaceae bacterium]|jgi:hypothetical protein
MGQSQRAYLRSLRIPPIMIQPHGDVAERGNDVDGVRRRTVTFPEELGDLFDDRVEAAGSFGSSHWHLRLGHHRTDGQPGKLQD